MKKALKKTLVLTSIVALMNCNATAITHSGDDTTGTCQITNVSEETTTNIINVGSCKITAYCTENYPHICNDGDSSKTATGTTPTPGRTIAVDPSVIPYGSEVIINGQSFIAEDCGGAIKGNRIDICFATHQEALEFGIQYANVSYVVRSDSMCKECRQTPCHPRCPNAGEPPVVCRCDNCDAEIREGDTMYVIGDNTFCEDCVRNGSTYAEMDDEF